MSIVLALVTLENILRAAAMAFVIVAETLICAEWLRATKEEEQYVKRIRQNNKVNQDNNQ